MQTFSYKGKAYNRMPQIVNADNSNGCAGCAFDNGDDTKRTPGCRACRVALGDNYCIGSVWIRDTPRGLAGYIALKLEES